MKRILLIILALALSLPVLAGCARDYDFYGVSTMLIPNDGGTIKQSNFPAEPPILYVISGSSAVQAWRGTHSWFVENEDGTGSGICADSPHPLDCIEDIQAVKVTKKATLTLNFEEAPTSITVRRYKLNSSDNDSYDEIVLNGNSLEVKAGEYLYEVIASWNRQQYNGTAYYAFRTEK